VISAGFASRRPTNAGPCSFSDTAFYSALTRLSDADPKLEAALKPAVEFFARRQRSELPAQS
jgi:hypothetical protein